MGRNGDRTVSETTVVIGLGTVGLAVAVAFAQVGHAVIGVERVDDRRKRILDRDLSDEQEPQLESALHAVFRDERLRIAATFAQIQQKVDNVIVCVGVTWEDGQLQDAEFLCLMKQIGEYVDTEVLVSVETTLPPGTMERKVAPFFAHKGRLVYAPERVAAGRLLSSIRVMPRIISGFDAESLRRGLLLYSQVCDRVVSVSSMTTAEMIKVAENAYRDVNIAFANEVSVICYDLGVDVLEVRRCVNDLPSIEIPDTVTRMTNPVRNMHIPGIGVGGYCIPKDSRLLLHGGEYSRLFLGSVPSVVRSAREVNDWMPSHITYRVARQVVLHDVQRALRGVKGLTVLILGSGFAPGVKDQRNSPSVALRDLLQDAEYHVVVHDPLYDPTLPPRADVVVLATAHEWYKERLKEDIWQALIRNRVLWCQDRDLWKDLSGK